MRSLKGLSPGDRRAVLREENSVDPEFLDLLHKTLTDWARRVDGLSENVIGAFPAPLSVVRMTVNGRERLVPLATEEAGVAAGIAKAAKLAGPEGFRVRVNHAVAAAQILLGGVPEGIIRGSGRLPKRETDAIEAWLRETNPLAGHGAPWSRVLHARQVDIPAPGGPFLEIAVQIDPAEAMGAKAATRLAEDIGRRYARRIRAELVAAIVTNGATGRRVHAEAEWPGVFAGDPDRARRFDAIYRWSWKSPFRAVTHVKGIMNGTIAAAAAFGQDTRAVAAAADAETRLDGPGCLSSLGARESGAWGSLKMTIPCATVGGATQHQMAVECRKMAGIEDAADLAAVMAACGLAANFAALLQLSAPEGFSATYERLKKRP
jgi:hydroxymethylglutaryl-CoA reductase